MKKKLLLITLILALVIEVALTVLCFFKPAAAIKLFGMQYNDQTAFLGYIIAWFCLLVSVLIVYAIILLKNNDAAYKSVVYILGFWWIGLGIGVYITFKKPDNLLLDSLKGLILVTLNYLQTKEKDAL